MVKKENSVVGVRLLDLFSGIGGFSLAASWVWGDELGIVGFCEIDSYCHKVLNKNFPGVPIYKDITTLDGNQFKNIDIITGGFPCQDISIAGRGKSLINEETGETTRSGLWFEMLRVISEVRPRYALIENVPMLTVRGGVRVIADLTEIGYDASWTIVSAADVGAWHNRKRIWIVAHSQEISDSESERRQRGKAWEPRFDSQRKKKLSRRCGARNVSDSNRKRRRSRQTDWKNAENARQLPRSSKHGYWHTEPELGRVANGISNRVDRLKGLGNSIVPQCAYEIFKYIARKNAKTFN